MATTQVSAELKVGVDGRESITGLADDGLVADTGVTLNGGLADLSAKFLGREFTHSQHLVHTLPGQRLRARPQALPAGIEHLPDGSGGSRLGHAPPYVPPRL
eukprot:gene2383-3099_t